MAKRSWSSETEDAPFEEELRERDIDLLREVVPLISETDLDPQEFEEVHSSSSDKAPEV